jgi:CRISPR-associated endonuclease Csn1
VVAYKPEGEWVPIDQTYEFCFSLSQNSLAEVTTPDGEVIRGYFKGVDRSTGAIALAAPESPRKLRRGIGAKTLTSFTKLAVDRLGGTHEVSREVRTWHGEAST